MDSISHILQERLLAYQNNPVEAEKRRSVAYNKAWAEAVNYFVERINKDNKKEKRPPTTFIAVRMKLVALREIDDLRWFYRECLKYSYTYQKVLVKGKPVRNTFSRCFYGALKIK